MGASLPAVDVVIKVEKKKKWKTGICNANEDAGQGRFYICIINQMKQELFLASKPWDLAFG